VRRAANATAALGISALNTSELQSRSIFTDFEEDIEFYRHVKGRLAMITQTDVFSMPKISR
jgi:hypothetical protein